MAYIGENSNFSFRDGVCEALSDSSVNSISMAELGRVLTKFYKRFCVGCCGYERLHLLYALCSGISECGGEVYLCEDTDMPSFRFAAPLLSSDCCVYISAGGHKLSFFDGRGFSLPDSELEAVMLSRSPSLAEKSGKINVVTSFRNIYVNNLRDAFRNLSVKIPAGISCGNKSVRLLWEEFFSGNSDDFVIQISDDGQRVNAYSTEYGFISADKLRFAYCVKMSADGDTVFIPSDFHYAADTTDIMRTARFPADGRVPDSSGHTRFLRDPLFMMLELLRDKNEFDRIMKKIPEIAVVRREIVFSSADKLQKTKEFLSDKGRTIIKRSGRNRLTLISQALSAETASELCSDWYKKLSYSGSEILSDKNSGKDLS